MLSLGAGLDLQETADYRGLSKDGRAVIIAQKRNVKKGSLDQRNRTILTDLGVEIGGVAVYTSPCGRVVIAMKSRVNWIRE